MLAPPGIDLVELSGGSYESPATSGRAVDERTLAREAYCLTLARELARTARPENDARVAGRPRMERR